MLGFRKHQPNTSGSSYLISRAASIRYRARAKEGERDSSGEQERENPSAKGKAGKRKKSAPAEWEMEEGDARLQLVAQLLKSQNCDGALRKLVWASSGPAHKNRARNLAWQSGTSQRHTRCPGFATTCCAGAASTPAGLAPHNITGG